MSPSPQNGLPRRARPVRLRTSTRARHDGFTLIESLITIVVLAIGVLALAMLQLRTLVDTRTASMRNVATTMAYNLADQMRSNEVAMTAGAFDKPNGVPNVDCYAAKGCTPAAMAGASFAAWLDDLKEALPAANGMVCIDASPNDGDPADPQCQNVNGAPYVIKIWWREDGQDAPQRFVTAFVP